MAEFNEKEYQTVILGALLHDIGKFYQRAQINSAVQDHQHWGEECFQLFFREKLSLLFNNEELNLIERFIGNHHGHEDYVTKADWVSAGMDRISLDNEETGDPSFERLESIFERISLTDKEPMTQQYAYQLNPLQISKEVSFPVRTEKKNLTSDFALLWDKFVKEFNGLLTINRESFLNSFYGLLEKYTWCIPSATYKDEPDVSLFDHLKTASAITGCLYCNEKADEPERDSLIFVVGDLSGIQSFIYRITKTQGTGGIAKRLRGRSFYLTMFQETIARHILHHIGLFKTHILFCSGGRFELLLPNTNIVRNILEETKIKVNGWCFREHSGEVSFILEWIKKNTDDLKDYQSLLEEVEKKIAISKKQKFLYFFEGDDFWCEKPVREEKIKVCPVCNINKISYNESACHLCELHKTIGKKLPKMQYLLFAEKPLDEINEGMIQFGDFGCVYLIEKGIKESWFEKDLVIDVQKINSTDINQNGFRFIGNTAPIALGEIYLEKDTEDEDLKVEKDDVLSFEILSDASTGDKRIGILKMDVDNLGLIFSLGLEGKRKSISRIATISRLMDIFFGGYLNRICEDVFNDWKEESQWEHKNKVEQIFYIVYSGGDDLLIVGPWSEIPKLAVKIQNEFKEFTANNPEINISAGIFLSKPKYPISLASKNAGEQLDISKIEGRNRITIFLDTVEWNSTNNTLGVDKLLSFGEEIYTQITKKDLPRGFVHKLLRIYKQFQGGEDFRFIPAIIYQLSRNIKNEAVKQKLKEKLITDMSGYFKKLRIPASYALLKSRKEG